MSDEFSIFGLLPATGQEVQDGLVKHSSLHNALNEKKVREAYGQNVVYNSLNNTNLGMMNFFSPMIMYEEPPEDTSYRWAMTENMKGFEDKYDFFVTHNPKSREHHDILKALVLDERNREMRIANQENFWGPMLYSAALTPSTWLPIPITKGMTVLNSFKTGAAYTAGIVTAEEVIRQTHTIHNPSAAESFAFVGSAAIAGGLFSSIVPTARYVFQKDTGRIIPNNKTDSEVIDDYFDEMQNNDTVIPVDFNLSVDAVEKNVKRNKTGFTNSYIDETGSVIEVGTARSKNLRKDKKLLYNPIKYYVKDGEEIIDVDDHYIKDAFTAFQSGEDFVGIPTEFRKILDTEKKFSTFLLRRELKRSVMPKGKTKNILQNEDTLSRNVMADAIKRNDLDFHPNFGTMPKDTNKLSLKAAGIFKKVVGKLPEYLNMLTPFGKQAKFLTKDRESYNKANNILHRLIGDQGTINGFADNYIAMDRSVMMNRDINIIPYLKEAEDEINKAYVLYQKGSREYRDVLNEAKLSAENLKNADTAGTLSQGVLPNTADITSRNVKYSRLKDRVVDAVDNQRNTQNTQPIKDMTLDEFDGMIGEFVMDENKMATFLSTAHESQKLSVEAAVKATINFYKKMEKDLIESGALLTEENIAKRISISQAQLKEINNLIKTGNQNQKDYLEQAKQRLVDELNTLEDAEPFTKGSLIPSEENNYINRIYDLEAIEEHPQLFKNVMSKMKEKIDKEAVLKSKDFKKFKQNKTFSKLTDDEIYEKYVDELVDKKIDHIVDYEAVYIDGENILPYVNKGSKPLMHRSIPLPSKDFLTDEVNFIKTGVTDLMRHYRNSVGTVIEMSKEFGDKNATNEIIDLMITIAKKPDFDINQANATVLNIDSSIASLYNLVNFVPPQHWSKNVASILSSVTQLNSMGSVALTSIPEMARGIANHGLSRQFKHLGVPEFNDIAGKDIDDLMKQVLKNQGEIYTYTEQFTLGGTYERAVNANMGSISSKRGIGNTLRNITPTFYIVNGLTSYTSWLKRYYAGISHHRFIEDLIAYANGKLAPDEIRRLSAYGFNKDAALRTKKLFDKNLIQKNDAVSGKFIKSKKNIYTFDFDALLNETGGREFIRSLRQAVKADVDRSVVTPNIADKINMQSGKVTITNQKLIKMLDKLKNAKSPMAIAFKDLLENTLGTGKFGLGTDLKRMPTGYIASNAFAMLTLQFFSWGIAANRRILSSALSGRDRGFMYYVLAAQGLSWGANALKYKGYSSRSLIDQVIMTTENSGVLGPASDVNKIIEDTQPLTGYGGIRDYYNTRIPFGERTEQDSYGRLFGAGPTKTADLISALISGTKKDKKNATKQLAPLQNLVQFKILNKALELGDLGDLDDKLLDRVYDIDNMKPYDRDY